MTQIPTLHSSKGYAAFDPGHELQPFAYNLPELQPHEILVKISHCGLCHTDLYMINNDWKRSSYPLVPGHEIIGHVVEKGALATQNMNDRVGVGWIHSTCQQCHECRSGQPNICLNKTSTYSQGRFGGFATHMIADSRFSFLIPEKLDSAHAAPLLCAGSTVYAPLTRYEMQQVAVIGIGGLGHLAIQFANALGYEVSALSHSTSKEKDAHLLGAASFYTFQNPPKPLSFDFILCTGDAPLDWNQILTFLKPNGILCFVSRPPEGITFDPKNLVSAQRTICGSNNASIEEMKEMLSFAAENNIRPWIEELPLSQINLAIEKLKKNEARYRIVCKI
ncbi:MAG TPA: NAD(P)-dependent alcohol dehydrogenase [Chlamydiales bacterium]|nr:NAD(P)-dependent alcohol dehydrogenase [Chlamydiales bacterium]